MLRKTYLDEMPVVRRINIDIGLSVVALLCGAALSHVLVVAPSITNDDHNNRADNERILGESLDRPVVFASYAPGRPSCSSLPLARTLPKVLREA